MNHLTEEKIDLYILNKKILGKEAEEIKLHLAECDLCKNVFNKLNNYYNKLSSLSEEKGSLVTINKSLESRSIEGIQDLNFILNRKKPNENKDRANIFDSFILFIKSLFLPVPGYSPAYKFIGPLLIIVINLKNTKPPKKKRLIQQSKLKRKNNIQT
ncbi:MAG: hypothetical protein NTU73_14170 [Ignavibacteriae bacterium]|nr:hypothetical protein [Ignavibacteriota bacterium]